ncbi:MAG: TatD family hydrolase [Anaerolineae bacterium]|nr:TatD family hydrolase [Anaerolineae bacterium]
MWIDAHTHIDRYDLVGEAMLASALAEIDAHRILTLSNSMDVASYVRNLELAEACPFILPVFGVHPWNAVEAVDHLEDYGPLLAQSPMFGELGLDYYFVKDSAAYPAQVKVLRRFLAAAEQQRKTVSLHTKGAEADVLEILEDYDLPRVIVHWYSGPLDILDAFIARGAYFTVNIAARYSDAIKAITARIPDDRLLTETDNPGGARDFIDRFGTPLLVRDVIEAVAEVRGTSAAALAQQVQANLWSLIAGDPWAPDAWKALLEHEPHG